MLLLLIAICTKLWIHYQCNTQKGMLMKNLYPSVHFEIVKILTGTASIKCYIRKHM